jgi:hypothetical protein
MQKRKEQVRSKEAARKLRDAILAAQNTFEVNNLCVRWELISCHSEAFCCDAYLRETGEEFPLGICVFIPGREANWRSQASLGKNSAPKLSIDVMEWPEMGAIGTGRVSRSGPNSTPSSRSSSSGGVISRTSNCPLTLTTTRRNRKTCPQNNKVTATQRNVAEQK